jgi:hypothetical protein
MAAFFSLLYSLLHLSPRRCICLGCLLLSAGLRPLTGSAQTPPAPAGQAIAPVLSTRQDTVQALHRLFETRRRTGKHLVTAGLVAIPAAVVISLVEVLASFGSSTGGTEGNIGAVVMTAGVLGGVAPGLNQAIKFRRAKERAVVAGYEQDLKPLPVPLRRKLKGPQVQVH